jgi:hypothetical protein
LISDWNTKSWTLGGVIRAKYLRWLGENRRVDLRADYALTYTTTSDESLSLLEASGFSNSLQLQVGLTNITAFKALANRFIWNTFIKSVTFPGQEQDELGFKYYFGFGAGLGLHIDQRLLGGLGHVNFAGLEVTALVGDDVRGGAISISFRY